MHTPSPSRQATWEAWVALQRSRLLAEHWRIGLIDAPIHTLLEPGPLPPVRWITPKEHAGYWADPFGLPDQPWICAERFDERRNIGWIERMAWEGESLRSLGPIEVSDAQGRPATLGKGLHASFPHLTEIDGQAYALAETGAARQCILYRVDSAGRWHSPQVLLDDVAAADPALFRWQGRFWLAFTDADLGPHDNLCLYHATGLAGPWQPHATRPARTGRGGSRMAGRFFEHEGRLYRPAQDCASGYGAAVVLYRVERLTPAIFEEIAVRRLDPDPLGPVPHGLHTVNAWGSRTLIDGKRMAFNPVTLARKLRARRPSALAR